jgi:hypothetical protein
MELVLALALQLQLQLVFRTARLFTFLPFFAIILKAFYGGLTRAP